MNKLSVCILVLIVPALSFAQVKDIKSSSANHSTGREGGSADGSGVLVDIMFNVVFGQLIQAQQQLLERRSEVPSMVSVELMLQSAVQPASYYLVHPRLRANWGLFSSDFRFNYL